MLVLDIQHSLKLLKNFFNWFNTSICSIWSYNLRICRSYYRCTHNAVQGCLATKIVQEEECSDSLMYRVVYTNKHTCNTSMSDDAEQVIFTSPPMPSSFFIFESKKSHSTFENMTKKEGILSASPINKESSGEMFCLHNEIYSSLAINSTLPELTMARGGEDMSSAPTIKDLPLSPTGLLDSYEFDFSDVDSILSSLE